MNKICLALDVDSYEKAMALVKTLKDHVGCFKVGKELFTRFGPRIVDDIHRERGRVFLDLKFHDIPNTVKGAARAAAEMGVFMFNVHASGGQAMMEAAIEGVKMSGRKDVIVLGVTVLTSIDQKILSDELRIHDALEDHVVRLAQLAQKSGLSGVVASAKEIKFIRKACGDDFVILTPGVRPLWDQTHDQKRVMTPKEAAQAGADYIVVGRTVTGAEDPMKAIEKVEAEIQV